MNIVCNVQFWLCDFQERNQKKCGGEGGEEEGGILDEGLSGRMLDNRDGERDSVSPVEEQKERYILGAEGWILYINIL